MWSREYSCAWVVVGQNICIFYERFCHGSSKRCLFLVLKDPVYMLLDSGMGRIVTSEGCVSRYTDNFYPG